MAEILILGLGNPFRGDDGIGAVVVAALQMQNLPPEVTIIDGGTPGLETVLLWQDYKKVLIIDAAEIGMEPGEWKRFLPEEVVIPAEDVLMQGTLHAAGLAEALALAEALDILPPELIFYGVQPAEIGWSVGLSKWVQMAVPALCKAISDELVNHMPHSEAAGLFLPTP